MKPKGCGACSVARIVSCGGIAVGGDTGSGLSFPKTFVRMNRAVAPNIQLVAFDNFGSLIPQKIKAKFSGAVEIKPHFQHSALRCIAI